MKTTDSMEGMNEIRFKLLRCLSADVNDAIRDENPERILTSIRGLKEVEIAAVIAWACAITKPDVREEMSRFLMMKAASFDETTRRK